MWSVSIKKGSALHNALCGLLRSYVSDITFAKLVGEWKGVADNHWVDKISTPLLQEIREDVTAIIDSHTNRDVPELYYRWSEIREHLEACHIYLGNKEILIRPLLPPTYTHAAFCNARQRIFMSATLGLGGDLERLTGRKNIDRLPAPSGFQSSGVGRRFFIFPTLSINDEESQTLLTRMQKMAGRSVVLTPSTFEADIHIERVSSKLDDYSIHLKSDIENKKFEFTSSLKAVAILANRYDGIDFPGDECRLLCVDGLPKAMNLQEKFVMSKMGAIALYNDRIQTRVLQAMGRCTRSLQDRSAVFVKGDELVDFLADSRKWPHFPPELQAELQFSVDQSSDVTETAMLENLNMFLQNSADWSEANNTILSAVKSLKQKEFPEMMELSEIASFEIDYQESIWNKDASKALSNCRHILGKLTHPNLRGYRALWHYLAGSAAGQLSGTENDAYHKASLEHFLEAKKAAPIISWLNSLAIDTSAHQDPQNEFQDPETQFQVDAIERLFTSMGTATNRKFETTVFKISKGLASANTFEQAQVELGELLGFTAGNDERDASPDPWWFGAKVGIVFETHANADRSVVLGATKSRQASTHSEWLKMYEESANGKTITPILLTPSTVAGSGAAPTLKSVLYWELEQFMAWVQRVINVMRELKGEFPGEGDLVWKETAAVRLENEKLTIRGLIGSLPLALEAMKIV